MFRLLLHNNLIIFGSPASTTSRPTAVALTVFLNLPGWSIPWLCYLQSSALTVPDSASCTVGVLSLPPCLLLKVVVMHQPAPVTKYLIRSKSASCCHAPWTSAVCVVDSLLPGMDLITKLLIIILSITHRIVALSTDVSTTMASLSELRV